MTPLRVLVVDDDDLVRAGLSAVLSIEETIDIVAEAGDGRQAIAQAIRFQPDVVLMDVRMPRLDGIIATKEILTAAPRARILILSTFEDDDYVFGSLHAGASGFLLKRSTPEELVAAIRSVAAGDSLLSPSITRRVIDRMTTEGAPPGQSAMRRLQALTPRERDVLELVAGGLSNNEIADTLVVEESTVKSHVKRILAKLDLRDRVQAVVLAYETGLVRPGRRPHASRASARRRPV